jgi:hypothetical protein
VKKLHVTLLDWIAIRRVSLVFPTLLRDINEMGANMDSLSSSNDALVHVIVPVTCYGCVMPSSAKGNSFVTLSWHGITIISQRSEMCAYPDQGIQCMVEW